jgi:hypothetical protein
MLFNTRNGVSRVLLAQKSSSHCDKRITAFLRTRSSPWSSTPSVDNPDNRSLSLPHTLLLSSPPLANLRTKRLPTASPPSTWHPLAKLRFPVPILGVKYAKTLKPHSVGSLKTIYYLMAFPEKQGRTKWSDPCGKRNVRGCASSSNMETGFSHPCYTALTQSLGTLNPSPANF